MLCVIGGACSGRRTLVTEHFPEAAWHRLGPGESPAVLASRRAPGGVLVVTGWAAWLQALLSATPDNEVVRQSWREQLAALDELEREAWGEALLILDEMGGGIVPMSPEARRLRDFNGWLTQDVAARSRAVWQVRHGLARRLDAGAGLEQGIDASR